MEKLILMSLMMVIIMAISSCSYKNPADETNRRMDEILEESKRKNEEISKDIKININDGGQPGAITISGVVVSADNKLDTHISTTSIAGIGKNGKAPEVAEGYKLVLKQKAETDKELSFGDDKFIVSIGCDQSLIADYAKKNNLEIKALSATVKDMVVIISANTLALCGNLEQLPPQPFKAFSSDHLILDGVDYTHVNNIGSLSFSTNRLTLIEENKITTKGKPTSMTILSGSSISLSVAKEFTPQAGGKLSLVSIGSDYSAEEPKQ